MIYEAVMEQPTALVFLERLVELARQKMRVLKERRHAALPAIVAAEEEILSGLEQLRVKKSSPTDEFDDMYVANSHAQTPQTFAQVATAVAELQRLNSTNAALLQEHLVGVTMCLDLLQNIAAPTYSCDGNNKEEQVIRPILDVRA